MTKATYSNSQIFFPAVLAFAILLVIPLDVHGYVIARTNEPVRGDVLISPAKIELELAQGTRATENITVTNRLSERAHIELSAEDIVGTKDGGDPIVLLGTVTSSFTLKDFLRTDIRSFDLESGESITVPVVIELPEGIEPGGRYAIVLATITTAKAGQKLSSSGASLRTRLGATFFVRVTGPYLEEGKLVSFATLNRKYVYGAGPVPFYATYENTGAVHENPYGLLTVSNVFGMQVYREIIPPTFVLPQSVRTLFIDWPTRWNLGYYRAELKLNRGYQNIIDSSSTSFFIISWQLVLLVLFPCFFAYGLFRNARMRYRLSRNI